MTVQQSLDVREAVCEDFNGKQSEEAANLTRGGMNGKAMLNPFSADLYPGQNSLPQLAFTLRVRKGFRGLL